MRCVKNVKMGKGDDKKDNAIECCHAFGGDSSQAFSLGLTLAMELLMTHFSVVEVYKKKWEDIFELKN